MKRLMLVVLNLLVVSLCACTAKEGKQHVNFNKSLEIASGQNGRACFYPRDVQGYGTLDYDVMSVNTNGKYYLVTFFPRCNSLQISPRALFQGVGGEVCGGGMSKVHTEDESCVIRQVFEFENRKQAFAMFDVAEENYKQQ